MAIPQVQNSEVAASLIQRSFREAQRRNRSDGAANTASANQPNGPPPPSTMLGPLETETEDLELSWQGENVGQAGVPQKGRPQRQPHVASNDNVDDDDNEEVELMLHDTDDNVLMSLALGAPSPEEVLPSKDKNVSGDDETADKPTDSESEEDKKKKGEDDDEKKKEKDGDEEEEEEEEKKDPMDFYVKMITVIAGVGAGCVALYAFIKKCCKCCKCCKKQDDEEPEDQ